MSSSEIIVAADAVIAFLALKGIKAMHNYPGGTIAPMLDACKKFNIKVITSRHEQGAGYAALAQAKLTQLPGIVAVTSGPGVTNVLTPVADAFFDSIPLLVFTGQVGTADLLTQKKVRQSGFQEVDTPSLMRPITKAQFQPKSVAELAEMLPKAWLLALEGRPGPVSIDLPMDVQRTAHNCAFSEISTPPLTIDTSTQINEFCLQLLRKIEKAQRPVIVCGNGMQTQALTSQLRVLLSYWPAAVSHSLLGIGVIPSNSPLCLGFHGHTGSQVAGMAITNADLVLVLGSRLDVRQTGSVVASFAPHAEIFRIDLDATELEYSRVKHNESLQAPLNKFLPVLIKNIEQNDKLPDLTNWHNQIAEYRQEFPWCYPSYPGVSPQYVIETISDKLNGKVICTTGVGSHQHWVARHFTFDSPIRTFFTSAGHGAMGYDLPTAIGAAIHSPESQVICIVGDGSFQMNLQELGLIAELELNIKILVIDNHRLGLVSQFQLMNWSTDTACGHKQSPDFSMIARAYGLTAFYGHDKKSFDSQIGEFINSPGPVLMHLEIDERHDISPMLLGGQTMDKMWPYYDTKGDALEPLKK